MLALNIKGVKHDWCFLVQQDPKYLNDWVADGLDIKEVSMDLFYGIHNSKLLSIEVAGKSKNWAFNFYAPEDGLGFWEADGLKVYVMETQ
jgi:hypothetical protein